VSRRGRSADMRHARRSGRRVARPDGGARRHPARAGRGTGRARGSLPQGVGPRPCRGARLQEKPRSPVRRADRTLPAPDFARTRARWKARQSSIDPGACRVHLHSRDSLNLFVGACFSAQNRFPLLRNMLRRPVFMDETRARTNMAPLRGWAAQGQRLIGRAPFGHWNTMTFVATRSVPVVVLEQRPAKPACSAAQASSGKKCGWPSSRADARPRSPRRRAPEPPPAFVPSSLRAISTSRREPPKARQTQRPPSCAPMDRRQHLLCNSPQGSHRSLQSRQR